LQNGPAAAAPAKNPDARFTASRHIDFPRRYIGVSEHGKTFLRFPKAQYFVAALAVASVQQSLIARQIGGRGGKR
jgi:hypothetical protein